MSVSDKTSAQILLERSVALMPRCAAMGCEATTNLTAPPDKPVEAQPCSEHYQTIIPTDLPAPSHGHRAVALARKLIGQDYREKLSLVSVARRAGVSAGYFSMLMKRALGVNFVDYVARLRVEEAKALLNSPHFRVGEVAFEVGFRSLSQFNRTFRRIAGMSPRVYRATLAGPKSQ